jgi:hypothetical protein
MAEMVAALKHLQPPQLNAMWLERFSPYFLNPAEHQITNVRPKPHYSLLYQESDADLGQLAYVFDYDHPMLADQELLEAQRVYARSVVDWQVSWRPNMACYRDLQTHLAILDEREGLQHVSLLSGAAAELYRELDSMRARSRLARSFDDIDESVLECQLQTWRYRRWVVRDQRERYVAVLPRVVSDEGSLERVVEKPRTSMPVAVSP